MKQIVKVKDYCKQKKYNFIDIDGVKVEFRDSLALVHASNVVTEEGLKSIQKNF